MQHLKKGKTMFDLKHDTGRYLVSTVGLFSPNLLLEGGFETMVFEKKKDGTIDWSEVFVKRYETNEEAEAGHAEAVALFERITK